MSKQREPIELIKAKGKKHLTKSEIEQRQNSEVKAPNDKVEAPKYLTKTQKDKFDKIAQELIELDIMSNLDCDALARYLISLDLYLDITKQLKKQSISKTARDPLELESRIIIFDNLSRIQDRYFKQCRMAASDLGLTITSRCRLVIPKAPEPKKNKFDKFGAG